MTTTEANPVGIYAGAVTEPPTPISDRARDYLNLDSLFSAEELALRDKVRAFVDERIRPNIAQWYEDAHFPREIVTEMGELGLLGMHLTGLRLRRPQRRRVRPGRAGTGGRRLRPAHLRLGAGLAGDERDLQARLRGAEAAVAAGHGRGRADRLLRPDRTHRRQRPGEHDDHAVRDGPERTQTGCSTAPSAGSAWPRSPRSRSSGRTTDDGVRGFVVPTDTPGFTATPIEPKLSMRASIQCDITLTTCGCPPTRCCPTSVGLKGPFACLNEARYGIIWGAMGAARDSYETALRLRPGAHASSTRRSRASS